MPHWFQPFLPVAALLVTLWLAYWSIRHGSWVSDDIAGIATFDGKLQHPVSWGKLFRWVRWQVGKIPNSNHRWKEDKQPPYQQSSDIHHRLNLYLASGLIVFFYSFLCRITSPTTAFLTALLFAVHPLGCQTIGWISGVGYLTGTFFMLAGLNIIFLIQDGHWMGTPMGVLLSLLTYTFFQWMAVEAWFGTVGAVLILLWLRHYPFAIIAGGFAIYQCFHTFKEALDLRRKIFKEQQMGQSTMFYPRKLIVVLKTLYYNLKLTLFPKRMGLYHTFCYHYEMPYVEYEDWYAWAGLAVAGALGFGIWHGPPMVSLSCLWFISFMGLFLNWITANQFVVDRYAWLPAAGMSLLVAAYLPLWAYWMVVGISLMRLWSHHYTYQDEFFFYHSNLLNFPESEVAWGNLGVSYLQRGMIGSAMDAWMEGIRRNKEYDVCWYNLSSALRQRGPLNPNYAPLFYQMFPQPQIQEMFQKDPMRSHLYLARHCLDQSLKAKTCHFPEPWKKELLDLDRELSRAPGSPPVIAKLIRPLLTPALT